MKFNNRIISLLLAVMLIVMMSVLQASAALPPVNIGDINGDGLDITDATAIQRNVAQLETFDEFEAFVADTDGDFKITIIDATWVQKKLNQLIDEFPVGNWSYIDLHAEALVSDYNFGATVGTPVTFTAFAHGYSTPLVYEFLINGEVVREYSEQNTFVHTFDDEGSYEVSFNTKNRAGRTSSHDLQFVVNEATQTPAVLDITSVYHKGFYDTHTQFEAIAKNGSAPYEFCFSLYMPTQDDPFFGKLIQKQDFSQDNTFVLDERLEDYAQYKLFVAVRDQNSTTDDAVLDFFYITPPPA